MRSPPTEEEGAAETCDEMRLVMKQLQPTFPTPLCHCVGGGREFGNEVEARKKEGVKGR